MVWSQVYDPFNNTILSTLVCAIPVLVLLGGLGLFHIRAHYAAAAGLVAAAVIAVLVIGMPAQMTLSAGFFGTLFAASTICWIIFNLIFLYRMTLQVGLFKVLQDSIGGITNDRRLQLVLIAFCFGAFFEGAAGGGTPVAVTGAILIGLGFNPLAASGLSLIANTAPVAYGGLGTPIIVLHQVTQPANEDYLLTLSAMVGRQLPFFSVIVPVWLVLTFCGLRRTLEVWPAIVVAGLSFAIPQFVISNYHGPWLVDMLGAMISMIILAAFMKVWKPKTVMLDASGSGNVVPREEAGKQDHGHSRQLVVKAWTPWVILTAVLFMWGLPAVKKFLNVKGVTYWEWPIPGLHNLVQRVEPAVAAAHVEPAVWKWGIISATGSGILIAAIIGGMVMGYRFRDMFKIWLQTFGVMKYSLLTILAMLALGYITRYAGMDGTLGLAFANTGWLYPFFGTMIGWIGVALTGTDAGSNALFGSQQVITANKLGLSPTLMAAANSSGGVMGKMIDAQSIVVASVATNQQGREGVILRFVFWHSIVLASLVGVLVMLQAYVPLFQRMVPQ
ncbi:MAG TPA: L-lactate permease [Burkholderiales bacterium]|jgi:lactate permease|nr:L-lactate permease [Burkholderiales bacterium]